MKTFKHLRVYRDEEQTLHRALVDYRRLLDLSSIATADKQIINGEIHRAAELLNRLVLLGDVPGCNPGEDERRFLDEEDLFHIADRYNLNAAYNEATREALYDLFNTYELCVEALRSAQDIGIEETLSAAEDVKSANEDLWDFIDYLEEQEREDEKQFYEDHAKYLAEQNTPKAAGAF